MSENISRAFDPEAENYRTIVEFLRPPMIEVAEALEQSGATAQQAAMVLHDILHTQLIPYITREVFHGN